jgi:hypothetical protein
VDKVYFIRGDDSWDKEQDKARESVIRLLDKFEGLPPSLKRHIGLSLDIEPYIKGRWDFEDYCNIRDELIKLAREKGFSVAVYELPAASKKTREDGRPISGYRLPPKNTDIDLMSYAATASGTKRQVEKYLSIIPPEEVSLWNISVGAQLIVDDRPKRIWLRDIREFKVLMNTAGRPIFLHTRELRDLYRFFGKDI